MMTYEFKGGTSSYTLGVTVQSNFGSRQHLTVRGDQAPLSVQVRPASTMQAN